MKNLVLASASPRRRELLAQLGYRFTVSAVDIDETPLADELPVDYLPRMSKAKAAAAGEAIVRSLREPALILAADTSVIREQNILGKPENWLHFEEMMQFLSGQWHEVMTSIALLDVSTGKLGTDIEEQTIVTRVKFRKLSSAQIRAYWATNEPSDKAGGYGIQGRAAVFVERIEGSYSNVVGLPLAETEQMLCKHGLDLCEIWSESGSS